MEKWRRCDHSTADFDLLIRRYKGRHDRHAAARLLLRPMKPGDPSGHPERKKHSRFGRKSKRFGHDPGALFPRMTAGFEADHLVGQLMEAWISKMPVNWIFAFCVQIWFLGPINRFLFRTVFKKQLQAE